MQRRTTEMQIFRAIAYAFSMLIKYFCKILNHAETIFRSLVIQTVCCPMAKSCKTLTKSWPTLWYKFYSLNWDFSSQKSAPSKEKSQVWLALEGTAPLEILFPSCIADFGHKVCSWARLFLHSSKNGCMAWRQLTLHLALFRISSLGTTEEAETWENSCLQSSP